MRGGPFFESDHLGNGRLGADTASGKDDRDTENGRSQAQHCEYAAQSGPVDSCAGQQRSDQNGQAQCDADQKSLRPCPVSHCARYGDTGEPAGPATFEEFEGEGDGPAPEVEKGAFAERIGKDLAGVWDGVKCGHA